MTRAVRSEDGGATWEQDPTHRETGFLNSEDALVVYRSKNHDVLERSQDSGIHWTECRLNVDGMSGSQFAQKAAGTQHVTLHFGFVAVSPRNANTIYGTFSVWVQQNSQPNAPQKSLDLPGIYVSYNSGDNWTLFAPELRGNRPDERGVLGIDPSDPNRMIGHGKSGLVMTSDGGKSWSPVGQQADLEAPAELKGRGEELARREYGASIPLHPGFTYLAVLQFEFQRGDQNIIYLVTNKGLFKTSDSGRTWRLIYAGKPSYYELNSLTIDPNNPNQLFLGTRDTVLISEDGGCHFHDFFDASKFVPPTFR